MPTLQTISNNASIDPAMVARIVREVVARLRRMESAEVRQPSSAAAAPCGVVDSQAIRRIADGGTITIAVNAVVTPSAKDDARERSITIRRTGRLAEQSSAKHSEESLTNGIIDATQPERAKSVQAQLSRRGIPPIAGTIVLSDSPALEVFRRCSGGDRASVITSIGDVDRFGAELEPSVWVVDMKRLNFIAAVNVVARIAQWEKHSR